MNLNNITGKSVERFDLIHGQTCFLLRGVFSNLDCENLLSKAKILGFRSANDKYPASYRNNARLQVDDEILAKKLFNKCSDYIPKTIKVDDVHTTLTGLNSRLRYCKYSPGQSFSIHKDGIFHQDKNNRSKLTFLLYLNDSSDYIGGETSFYDDLHGDKLLATHTPNTGDILVFDHNIWHSGNLITRNSKYILRSDFIYKGSYTENKTSNKHHNGYIWKIINLKKNLIATSSRDKSIKIWDSNLKLKQTLTAHKNSVLDMSVSESGDIYAASRDGHMSKWINNKGRYTQGFNINTTHPCTLSIRVLQCGRVVTTGSDNTVRLWSADGLEISRSQICADWHWQTIEYKNQLISCSADGSLYVWNINSLSLVRSFRLSERPIRCMEYANDNLYVGLENGCVKRLNLSDFELFDSWTIHKGAVRDLKCANGQLITCGEDNNVYLHNLTSNEPILLHRHDSFATSITYTCDNIYSVSYDGEIRSIDNSLIHSSISC